MQAERINVLLKQLREERTKLGELILNSRDKDVEKLLENRLKFQLLGEFVAKVEEIKRMSSDELDIENYPN